MKRIYETIQEMRDQQLVRGMRAAALIGLLALLCSFLRVWAVGWHNIVYLHVILYLVVLAAAFLDKRLSFHARTAIILLALYAIGLAGLISWGLGAFSMPALFCLCILATLFLGARTGIAICIACIGTVGIVGVFVYLKILVFNIDARAHLNSPATWLLGMVSMTLFAGIVVVILGTLNRQVEDLTRVVEKRNDELLESNRLLRSEIDERIRSEEERKKVEKKLHDAKKLETIGTLAGGVAHDLNNILGGIVNYPDLLLEDLPDQSPLRDTLEIIKRSGIKAAAIVDDMLTLARRRIESREVVSLNAIIEEYCESPEFMRLKQYHRLVNLEVKTDPGLMNVFGSPIHIFKIVMNLVSNAAEAMSDGGTIVISTENREIDAQEIQGEEVKKGSYSVLCVSDAGIGIPAENLQYIFDPFYSKKKLGRSGTGLGMSVVRGSVMDHDGYIDVSSVEGKGTTFTVYFPSTQEQPAPIKAAIPRSDLRGRGESILIIDDVEEQRDIASRILKELGYFVLAFKSGEEAIEYLKTSSVDLLILDMLMDPGIDGLDTYKKIAKIHPGQKAIITTGYAETERLKEALQSGVGCYLRKPYLVDEIAVAVKVELE